MLGLKACATLPGEWSPLQLRSHTLYAAEGKAREVILGGMQIISGFEILDILCTLLEYLCFDLTVTALSQSVYLSIYLSIYLSTFVFLVM